MDIFVETLVRRKFTAKDKTKIKTIFVILVLSAVVFGAMIPFYLLTHGIAYLSTISMLFCGLIIFLCWQTLKKMRLEFEYIIVNNSLDFDKIIAQKKRERIVSLDLKTVEEVGVYDSAKFRSSNFGAEFHAERDTESRCNYYLIFPHTEFKRTLVVFTPDDRMLDALRQTLPRQLVKNLPKEND
ncbi:MAG: hypothetical protein IJY33_00950 [Oscillospiraceae bacterium]|nr:hypothetical protein [Oscillospiraceae bacterium]